MLKRSPKPEKVKEKLIVLMHKQTKRHENGGKVEKKPCKGVPNDITKLKKNCRKCPNVKKKPQARGSQRKVTKVRTKMHENGSNTKMRKQMIY